MKNPHYNLSGMKRLKTANGFKFINTDKRTEIEDQVQVLVTQHRAKLIDGILGGLPQYVDFRFHVKIDSVQQEKLKELLLTLKQYAVSIDDCEPIVEELIKKETAVVKTQEFYYEIDQKIKYQLWLS